jgi:CRP-like cAMP-binding protein/Fe-S-cluster-containing hydrogenase component 2
MKDDRTALARRAEHEALACIGCHDCMLACPLPEARTMQIAELNAAVLAPVVSSVSVARFVTACTQCRQCVPVCPADLNRADMVLFNKGKVEDAVPDHALLVQRGAVTAPSRFTLDALAATLTSLRLFGGVAPRDLRRTVLHSTLRECVAGELLCDEGEYHERLCVVLEGALEQVARAGHGARGRPQRILVLPAGSFFGELAVMSDQPEPFAIAAAGPALVLEVPKVAVHRLMAEAPVFRDTMQELYARRALFSYAHKPGALGALPEQAIAELLAGAELVLRHEGERVVREGDPPRDVYLVRSGFLRVTKVAPRPTGPASAPAAPPDEVSLVYYREGDLFGAVPLLLNEPGESASVTAASRAELIRIPGPLFVQVLARFPDARTSLPRAALDAERAARVQAARLRRPGASLPMAPQPGALQATGRVEAPLDFLVEQGIAKGREVLVIDQTRCTACQSCVDGCGRRHGQSRLELRGVQIDDLLFPAACRHCEDPVCLLCSVGGIARLPSGEITIVEDNCIGCGACAERCPYGNIRMHPVTERKRGLWDELLDFLRGKPKGDAASDASGHAVARRAVKCDLCAGYDDYACVTACPVGAAFRIDPAAIFAGGDAPLGLAARR